MLEVCRQSLTNLTKGKDPLFSPLFDADGVRSELIGKATGDKIESKPPDCVVVEDELNFCFYHSYVAYRTGYRVLPVNSFAAFKDVENWFPGCTSPTVLIEDMSLAFFDKSEQESLIKLKDRDGKKYYEKISERAKLRLLVTIGQSGSREGDLKENRDYLEKCQGRTEIQTGMKRKCECEKYFAEEPKPAGGIFRLVELLALKQFLPSELGRRSATGKKDSDLVVSVETVPPW